MNKSVLTVWVILGVVAAAVLLLVTGMFAGRFFAFAPGIFPGGMMSFLPSGNSNWSGQGYPVGPGMMGGSWQGNSAGQSQPVYPYGRGGGMIGGGMMGGGMMGSFGSSGLAAVEPLTLEQAQLAVEEYLVASGLPDLSLKEIMIFDNHAYAEIIESSTRIGAMELLVDPVSLVVYPEYGPNMMWNLRYGMMRGGRGMMNGWSSQTLPDASAEMRVTPAEAIEKAQQFLDTSLEGTQVGEHADPFYGYYTLHIERDGSTIGMLSVNGYNGQVFLHTWHGKFVDMLEFVDE